VYSGRSSEALYVVIRGAVDLVLWGHQGRILPIERVPAGGTFGELTGGTPRVEPIVATPSTLLSIAGRAVLEAGVADPQLALRLLALQAARTHRVAALLEEGANAHVHRRLACVLLRLVAERGQPHRSGGVVVEPITQTELAEMTWCVRESVNKCLSSWRRRDIVLLEPRAIVVLQPDTLRRSAGLDVGAGQ
jgi:CRP-like cAMP-binding protein